MAHAQTPTRQAKRAPVASPTKGKTTVKKMAVTKTKVSKKNPAKAARNEHAPRDLTELRVDEYGRIVVGRHLAKKLFSVSISPDGTLTLRPAMIVPAAEAWFFEDKERVASMDRAMAQSKQGMGVEVSLDELFDL